jgi:imidazoleglycerol phosphate synthase glutamine amidotransferase subunit HisH
MGWNNLERARDSRLLDGLGDQPYVYFANSFYAPEFSAASAVGTYGVRFTAILEHENISAVQFHPEKSGPTGLRIVRNFIENAG